jgi:hypothetical protein
MSRLFLSRSIEAGNARVRGRSSSGGGQRVEWFLLIWDPITHGQQLHAALLRPGGHAGSRSDAAAAGAVGRVGGRRRDPNVAHAAAAGAGAAAAAAAAAARPVICCRGCGARAKRRISRSAANPGRPFFQCPRPPADRTGPCAKYFLWESQHGGGSGHGGSGGSSIQRRGWESMVKRGVHTLRKSAYQVSQPRPSLHHRFPYGRG